MWCIHGCSDPPRLMGHDADAEIRHCGLVWDKCIENLTKCGFDWVSQNQTAGFECRPHQKPKKGGRHFGPFWSLLTSADFTHYFHFSSDSSSPNELQSKMLKQKEYNVAGMFLVLLLAVRPKKNTTFVDEHY